VLLEKVLDGDVHERRWGGGYYGGGVVAAS
jgi:hypothetical protein